MMTGPFLDPPVFDHYYTGLTITKQLVTRSITIGVLTTENKTWSFSDLFSQLQALGLSKKPAVVSLLSPAH